MKKYFNYLLGLAGYKIEKIKTNVSYARTTRDAIRYLVGNHPINTIIDVGASNGMWSRSMMNFYPDARYFLIEANPAHQKALELFVVEKRNAEFVLAAAGASHGGDISFVFDENDPYAGQASYKSDANSNLIPVTSIDFEVQARKMEPPYLIKLDTHGFEVPIFEGASNILEKTEIIVVECYNFKISPECLLFYEMCVYLDGKGFRCIDLVDPMWRPYDNSFWQMDLVFIRKDSPQFSYTNYQ